jgi:hypothetical protein
MLNISVTTVTDLGTNCHNCHRFVRNCHSCHPFVTGFVTEPSGTISAWKLAIKWVKSVIVTTPLYMYIFNTPTPPQRLRYFERG